MIGFFLAMSLTAFTAGFGVCCFSRKHPLIIPPEHVSGIAAIAGVLVGLAGAVLWTF